MKNTRKKMLLSSVAMLLVALIALGSATYAWFTINKEVTASKMKVTAATTAGLQITNTNGGAWARDVEFTLDSFTLTPTSRGYTSSALQSKGYLPADVSTEGDGARAWVSGAANNPATNWSEDAGRPDVSTNSGTIAQANNANYAEYRVGIKSSGSSISGVKMDVSFENASGDTHNADKYVRVIVLQEGASNTETVKGVIGDGSTSTKAVTALSGTSPSTLADQAAEAKSEVSIGSVTSTATYFRILMWFEGQDDQCTDANQAAVGSAKVKFYF